jgi:hypothetical protein
MNPDAPPHFDGLTVPPFNLVAHYPLDDYGQSVMEEWLAD